MSTESDQPQMVANDEAMAANVAWAAEQEGSQGKVLVFAHNTHVQNAPIAGGAWGGLEHAPTAMGQHLRQRFGRDLVIVGSAAAAAPGHQTLPEDPEGIEAALLPLGKPRLLLDLRAATETPAARQWLEAPRTVKSGANNFEIVAPGVAFDAILFFDKMTPANSSGVGR